MLLAALQPTLSSWESGCSRLCCWMAIGGGRGTASAPSSPSSSPQLCMPDEEDLDRVPLLSPSLRIRWGVERVRRMMKSVWHENPNAAKLFSRWSAAPHLLQGLVLRRGGAVVRVLLRAVHGVHVLPGAVAVLLVLVGELLDVAVRFARTEPAHGAGQPLPQGVARALGPRRAVRAQGVAGARLQGVVAGYGQSV